MPAFSTIAIIGLALTVVGTGVQFIAGQKQAKAAKKSAKAQRDAAAEQQKLAALAARRDRRRTIRTERIARGAALNIGGQVGAGESSGLRGGLSSLASQAGANLGFSTQTEGLGRNIFDFNIQASKFRSKAASAASLGAFGAGITSLGSSLFNNATGIGGFFGSSSSVPNFGNRGGGVTGGGR